MSKSLYWTILLATLTIFLWGTLGLDSALRQVMDGIQREMVTTSREQLQKIPSRLIMMAFPALLMPALFILVWPLAARVIANLQGMNWGGGF